MVTTKGQITIPKELRDRFGIEPGVQVDFTVTSDGIRLRKVVDRAKQHGVLGCLKKELAEHSVKKWMDDLRGSVELPRSKKNQS